MTQLITDLEVLIKKITEKSSDAVTAFILYLNAVSLLPTYSAESRWDKNWRSKVYNFGTLFADPLNVDPSKYFIALDKSGWENNEALAFIHSEMIWNFWSGNLPLIKDEFSELIKKFPANPEFYHTYGHYLVNKKDYENAIINYKKAAQIEVADPFVNSLFQSSNEYFSLLIQNGKLDKADAHLTDIQKFFKRDDLKDNWVFNNILVAMRERLGDHKLISQRINGLNELIDKRVEGLRGHLINVVALFTSIIGYILIGTNMVISQHSIKESFLMMYGLGIVLVIFVIAVNYQFKSHSKGEKFWQFYEHRQFWAIISLIIILLFSYWSL